MKFRTLGRTGIKVSAICLGTMTFGSQNDEAEGHAQLDLARDRDINFIDTAEMYPYPRHSDTYGLTEQIVGSWLKGRRDRDQIVLATKVSGPGMVSNIRPGRIRLDRRNITMALEASLRRLQTDYIDLYQLHWPDRAVNSFGRLGISKLEDDEDTVPIEETLDVLDDLVKAGKVRHVGVSNETPWGVMRYLALAEKRGWPRIQSIQNPYNLLNRSFEVGLAEIGLREEVGLLAYSPLGMATLTGKYMRGARPEGARLTMFPQAQRYLTPSGIKAAEKYVMLARQHGLKPEQMAIAFTLQQQFTTASIIGATSLEQLVSNIDSINVTLSAAVLDEIERIHQEHTYPCP